MFFPAYIPRRRTALGWEIAQNCSAMWFS
jgi:hypothetical protein